MAVWIVFDGHRQITGPDRPRLAIANQTQRLVQQPECRSFFRTSMFFSAYKVFPNDSRRNEAYANCGRDKCVRY